MKNALQLDSFLLLYELVDVGECLVDAMVRVCKAHRVFEKPNIVIKFLSFWIIW